MTIFQDRRRLTMAALGFVALVLVAWMAIIILRSPEPAGATTTEDIEELEAEAALEIEEIDP